jgi:hypothetical protein
MQSNSNHELANGVPKNSSGKKLTIKPCGFVYKMMNEDLNEKFIPGVFSRKTNIKFHYCHIAAASITLLCIMITIIVTAATVHRIQHIASETKELIQDMNELLPDARFASELLGLLCKNKNFTNYYANVRELCSRY